MKHIITVRDEDVGLVSNRGVELSKRTAARAILKKGKLIAILHVSKDKFYKLPGGGVEKDETIEQALHREVFEETGCTFKVTGEVGETHEYRTQQDMDQISYCYFGDMETESPPTFTKEERSEGYKLIWVPLDKAIELVESNKPTVYNGKFIIKRDAALLREAKRLLK
ncbi:MAG: NUDIX domain-containing protein [Candidatus Micrarchaeota archaeon]